MSMNRWVKLLQECTFTQLAYLWFLLGIGFASTYYLVSLAPQNALLYMNNPLGHGLSDFLEMIYFSFMTLTATSPATFMPLGVLKMLNVIELFCGLITFGLLISKIISARQEKLIEEIYDLSFEEKVSKLRSTLYVYRANTSRVIDRIQAAMRVRNFDITDLEANLEGLKSSINRIERFLVSESKKSVTKVDELTLNLLFNSLSLSVSKIIDTINLLNARKYDWKRKAAIVKHVSSCIASTRGIQSLYEKKQLKDELKSLLKTIEGSLKQLEDLTK